MEIPEDVDELLDGLPLHLQAKVLKAYGGGDALPPDVAPSRPYTAKEILGYSLWGLVALPLALAVMPAVFLMSITVILIPVAVVIAYLGCYPLVALIMRIMERDARLARQARESEEESYFLTEEDLRPDPEEGI